MIHTKSEADTVHPSLGCRSAQNPLKMTQVDSRQEIGLYSRGLGATVSQQTRAEMPLSRNRVASPEILVDVLLHLQPGPSSV